MKQGYCIHVVLKFVVFGYSATHAEPANSFLVISPVLAFDTTESKRVD